MNKAIKIAILNLLLNITYSVYYLVLGILTESLWLLNLAVYYFVLSSLRFFVLLNNKNTNLSKKFAGVMLMLLAFPLSGTVILSILQDRGTSFHMIVMIAIAAFTFTKITLAIINLVKSYRNKDEKLITLRNIVLAEAVVSIFSLQRSMLVSFEGMTLAEIKLFNALTGGGVIIIVFLLGLNLLYSKNKKTV